MFGAMHFTYYINRSIATKVNSPTWAVNQQHTAYIYMSCGKRWAQTNDVYITSPPLSATPRHTNHYIIYKSDTILQVFIILVYQHAL